MGGVRRSYILFGLACQVLMLNTVGASGFARVIANDLETIRRDSYHVQETIPKTRKRDAD